MYKSVVELVREEDISNHSFNWPRVCHIYDLGLRLINTYDKGFDPKSSKV